MRFLRFLISLFFDMSKSSNIKEPKQKVVPKKEEPKIIEKPMSKYTWLIDPGHGGVINGVYQTPGKRSYFKDGILLDENRPVAELESECDFKFYEGENTRIIASILMNLLKQSNIKYIDVTDGSDTDVKLSARVNIANNQYTKDKNCIYLSIHHDAFNKQSAQGFSVYTSIGQTSSDTFADVFFKYLDAALKEHKDRIDESDGDKDKEANYYVLKKTAMPAVLVETLFYTNWKEVQVLKSKEGQAAIANALFKAIKEIENIK